jgi:hypothetical protein
VALRHELQFLKFGTAETELQRIGEVIAQCVPFSDDDGNFADLLSQLDRIEVRPLENVWQPQFKNAA